MEGGHETVQRPHHHHRARLCRHGLESSCRRARCSGQIRIGTYRQVAAPFANAPPSAQVAGFVKFELFRLPDQTPAPYFFFAAGLWRGLTPGG